MLQPLQSTLVSLSFPFEIFIAAFADGLVVVQTFLVRFTERLPVEPGVRYPLRILYSPNDWILQSYNMRIVRRTDSDDPSIETPRTLAREHPMSKLQAA